MGRRYRLLLLLILLPLIGKAQAWQKDSVAYQLRGNKAVQLTTNGYIVMNLNNTIIEDNNPALPIGLRRRSFVEVRPEINLHLRGNYLDRLQLDLSYDTETMIANRRKRVRLQYLGEQFDLIQRLEAGNVRMESRNPLIDSGQELFGLKGDFLLGSLTLQVVMSRQHSEERKIVVQGGRELRQTELRGSDYDFAQHFFLSEFFAQRYDTALADLPLVVSEVYVERIEVWVTSLRQDQLLPNSEPITAFQGATLSTDPPSSASFEATGIQIASAQRLPHTAYTLNPTLGFISLHAPLAEGQVLAVAYRYRYNGETYEVGELTASKEPARVALLAERDKTPHSPLWKIMMKNGYSLRGARRNLEPDDLNIQLTLRDHQGGIERPVVESGAEAGRSWMDLFGWDRADAMGIGGNVDGLFDMIEGVTYLSSSGTLFFPFREPMVSVPRGANGGEEEGIYPVFQSLYTETKRNAKEELAKDRFLIRAEVSGSSTQTISLETRELAPGSVKVEAGGRQLSEGIDYTIDYMRGYLTLTTDRAERIEITIQEHERVRRKEKSLIGAELNWAPMAGLNIGGTLLHYWEESQRMRTRWGEEALRNTMWGVHASFERSSQEWTQRFNDWSGLSLKEPISLLAQASYAELHSEYNTPEETNNRIVIDDFEQGNYFIDLTYPQAWQLGPLEQPSDRAQLAWFMIDPLLVRDGAKHQPAHLANDPKQRSHPLVREVTPEEFYPKRTTDPLLSQAIPMLNLSYYPEERGPYNTDSEWLTKSGTMVNPREMYGSIVRPLEINDLESSGYTYIEAWVLDPFSLAQSPSTGELYLDLGRVREHILPEPGLFFEGSQPKRETQWGRIADQVPQVYGFDTTEAISMEEQDIGLDGLSSIDERNHPRYSTYLSAVERITGFTPWRDQPFGSPLEDPAGDDYHFFLGDAWDAMEASIIERYKYINGVEGNSIDQIVQGVPSARTWLPDTEDFNRDMIQEDEERYLRFRVPISPAGLSNLNPQVIGELWLDAGSERERWVKIRIPLQAPYEQVGTQPSLQDVQNIRMTLTGFESEVHIRVAQFRIVSTSWAEYENRIEPTDQQTASTLVGHLSLEEDSRKSPIPYVSPPSVRRDLNNSPLSLYQEDEQALFIQATHLSPNQPVAAYKELSLDLRHYERLQLFSHLESSQELRDGEVELFIRLGHDFTDNYYEYRIPLTATPIKDYSSYSEYDLAPIVWPKLNEIDLLLQQLPELKMRRDQQGIQPGVPYEIPDPHRTDATIVVQGHPSLGEVSALLIGIRNRGLHTIDAEVWVNELSASGTRAMGGRALHGAVQAHLGELAAVHLNGQYRSAGFGGVTSDTRQLELSDHQNISLRTSLQLGLLLPERWQLRIPIRYSFDHLRSTPYYDPYNSDVRSTFATDRLGTLHQRQSFQIDEIRYIGDRKSAPFWSPKHLLLRYQLLSQRGYTPEIQAQHLRHATAELSYSYDTSTQSYIRLNSRWNRLYQYHQYVAQEQNAPRLSTLQSKWDWIRGLQLRQELLRGLTLSLQSTTIAIIEEPFEARHRTDHQAQFELLTSEILRDILALGTTQSYSGNLELTYRLPKLNPKVLQPLDATLTWRSSYRWDSGSQSSSRSLGNRAQNSGYIDLLARYDLSKLWERGTPALLGQASIHFRHTTGSTLPGIRSSAGKALGIAMYEHHIAPSLAYMLALANPAQEIKRAERNNWLLREDNILQPVSYFWRQELDASLTLTPLKGLEIQLQWFNNQQKHTQITPYQPDIPHLIRGALRFSTITTLGNKWRGEADLPQDFIRSNLLTSHINNGLPSLLSTLPNWTISYNLTHWHDWLTKHFSGVKLTHSYRAFLDLPTYHNTPTGSTPYDLQSIVAYEELNPLIGLEVRTKWGLALEERFIQRHSNTLLSSSQRVLLQRDHELLSRASYTWSFAPLFTSDLKLLKAFKQSLSLQLNHAYTRSMLSTQQIATGEQSVSQGVRSHNLQIATEYTLSEAISLRAFYERQQRDPLVSNYGYPYVRTSYGVIARLRFRP